MSNKNPRLENLKMLKKKQQSAVNPEFPIIKSKPRLDQERVLASPVQYDLWINQQINGDIPIYNEHQIFKIDGELHPELLEHKIEKVILKHESFRTNFFMAENEQLFQIIHKGAHFKFFETINLTNEDTNIQWQTAMNIAKQEVEKPYDLSEDALFRAILINLGKNKSLLIFCAHHIIIDAWSWRLILEDIFSKNTNLMKDTSESILQYPDYSEWLDQQNSQEKFEKDKSFWSRYLSDAAKTLQFSPNTAKRYNISYRGNRTSLRINKDLSDKVHKLAKKYNVTTYMVLLSTYATVLYHQTRETNFVIGTPVAGRDHPSTKNAVGCFINILPLHLDLHNSTFGEMLQNIKILTLNAFQHQNANLNQILNELEREKDPTIAASPRFQLVFTFQNERSTRLFDQGDLKIQPVKIDLNRGRYDLSLLAWELSDGIELTMEYATDLFLEETTREILNKIKKVLEVVVYDPMIKPQEMNLLSKKESAFFQKINQTDRALIDSHVIDSFNTNVRRYPYAEAVVCDNKSYSYKILDDLSNGLANMILKKSIDKKPIVGIMMDKSVLIPVTILGAWKAKGTIVALDTKTPKDRLEWIVKDANISFIITTEEYKNKVTVSIPVNYIDINQIETTTGSPPISSYQENDPAYIIYTSGSTGKPKGVLVEHKGLPNLIASQKLYLDIKPGDRVLQFASFTFDAAIFEMMLALGSGATLMMAKKEEILPGDDLANFILSNKISHVVLVPSVLNVTPDKDYSNLRRLMIAGEEASQALIAKWASKYTMLNLYGPTENTIWTTIATLDPEAKDIPIGVPILNTKVYILDKLLKPMPKNMTGEIYIGGIGVARGYINNSKKTEEHFVSVSTEEIGTRRLYKTGDIGKWNEKNQLVYLGRKDSQIKIQGYRIELNEIEAILLGFPNIEQAIVVAKQVENDKKILVAYLQGKENINSKEILRNLQASLPPYMVPASIIQLEAFPLTSNNKIDKNKLVAIIPSYVEKALFSPPKTNKEIILSSIVAEVIDIDPASIDIHTDLFYVGVDSISSIKIAAKAKNQGIDLQAIDIFTERSIANISKAISFKKNGENEVNTTLKHVPGGNREYPLSPFQHFGLKRYLKKKDAETYLVSSSYRIKNKHWDEDILKKAWETVSKRHDSLKSKFVFSNLNAASIQVDDESNVPVYFLDLRTEEESLQKSKINEFLDKELVKGINLHESPYMRVTMIQLKEDDHIMVWTRQHLMFDGWSRSPILEDFFKSYDYIEKYGTNSILENLGYSNYDQIKEWEKSLDVNKSTEFFKEYLKDYIPRYLDIYPSKNAVPEEGKVKRWTTNLSKEDETVLINLAKEKNVTFYECLQFGLALSLTQVFETKDVVLPHFVSGRNIGPADMDTLVGNTLRFVPVRFNINKEISWSNWIIGNRSSQTRVENASHIPIDNILRDIGCDYYLVYESYPTSSTASNETSGWEHVRTIIPKTTIPYRFEILSDHNALVLSSVVYENYYRNKTAKIVIEKWKKVLQAMTDNKNDEISKLTERKCSNEIATKKADFS